MILAESKKKKKKESDNDTRTELPKDGEDEGGRVGQPVKDMQDRSGTPSSALYT